MMKTILSFAIALALSTAAACAAPTLFAPNAVSSSINAASPAFTPDGNDVYYSVANAQFSAIVHSTFANGMWSKAQVAPFSGRWRDLEPTMSPDGSFMVFASNRPYGAGTTPLDGHYGGQVRPTAGGNLWLTRKTAHGWSEPQHLPASINANDAVFSPSIVADGSLYFMRATGDTGMFQLYRSQFKDGAYQTPAMLSFDDPRHGSFDPAVSAGDSFAIFSSTRPPSTGNDLFIVFRTGTSWSAPVHLEPLIGAPGHDIEARLSPDNHTLYYTTAALTPVVYPASSAYLDGLAWNNGLGHIWQVDLAAIIRQLRASVSPM